MDSPVLQEWIYYLVLAIFFYVSAIIACVAAAGGFPAMGAYAVSTASSYWFILILFIYFILFRFYT